MRFFVPPSSWEPAARDLVLDGAESKHAVTVLRLKVGDEVTVFDGAGRHAVGRLVAAEKRLVEVRLEGVRHSPPPAHKLVLAVAIPKGSTMDWIIEKAVELGVSEVVPLLTRRTVVRLDAAEGAERREKWERTAIEACKQCGQNWLPRVQPPRPLEQALADHPASGFRWPLLACLQPDALPLVNALAPDGDGADSALSPPLHGMVWIGPEGDFSPEEYSLLRAAGLTPVSLGPIVLRVETAAFYCLSVLRFCAESVVR